MKTMPEKEICRRSQGLCAEVKTVPISLALQKLFACLAGSCWRGPMHNALRKRHDALLRTGARKLEGFRQFAVLPLAHARACCDSFRTLALLVASTG